MDRSPRAVHTRTLVKAADVVGGSEALRRRLNVSALVLGLWMSGVQPPPMDVFLKAVDIVEEGVVDSLHKRDRRDGSA
jgi:hypothetical protein